MCVRDETQLPAKERMDRAKNYIRSNRFRRENWSGPAPVDDKNKGAMILRWRMTAPIAPQVPWWLDRTIMLPILYTLFGAGLGFAASRLKDWLDERKARKSFLAAVRVELATISEHLDGTLKDATACKEALDKGEQQVLHLATTFQTAIYTSQIGKLKSVLWQREFVTLTAT